MAAGDSYGASLATSASSGVNLSGATDLSGGGNYGGFSYGPGSVLLGKGESALSSPLGMIAVVVIVGLAALFLLPFLKGGR